jgi:hypothetical protein
MSVQTLSENQRESCPIVRRRSAIGACVVTKSHVVMHRVSYMNSAPICDPRRHLTRARRPRLASRDIKRVNTPGTVSAAWTVI